MIKRTIFEEYYNQPTFQDRFLKEKELGVDVIIPVLNTNVLWKTNLYSFYREIPINNLLIGDGGCTDDTLEILNEFPRVKIINQLGYKSQGYSIKELMLNVETEYFIYLHADVYLPSGWFDSMYNYREKYDWFECFRKMTIQFEYPNYVAHSQERAYSGSQFGRSDRMKKIINDVIDDDYLQRNEDIIFMELIRENGGTYGKIPDTFHYHQVTNKKGELEPHFESVNIVRKTDPVWEKKIFIMQYKGIIKYLQPKQYLINNVFLSILKLKNQQEFDWKEFKSWVKKTNPVWMKHINRRKFYGYQFKRTLKGIFLVIEQESQFGYSLGKLKKKIQNKN